ncbi:MAG: F0F1 ATP synthase subunit B [Aliiglaciecola sp.]|uniref:F0F1 ATP synthase subunit B n=1 Tax=Aliiglaciecola sp. TaxID=1872441 RepID=UPI00329886EB
MPIDWFTVIAQTVNFLILLWLLKRFLYHPIINGLNKRETKIAQILSDAKAKNEQAEALQEQYQLKLKQIEKQRSEIINTANQEAKAKRQELLDIAQQEAAEILETRLHSIEQEIQALQQQVVQRSMQEVFSTSQKILNELADSELQTLMFNKLLLQLNTLDKEQHAQFSKALNATTAPIHIHSTFELTSAQKSQLQQWVEETYSSDSVEALEFNYTINRELICGIEVIFDGWKIPWSTQNYLNSMQENLQHQLPKKVSAHISTIKTVNKPDLAQSNIR